MSRFAPFVEWLWSKRDVPYTFCTTVVTEGNRRLDASVPVPPLTLVEAENLFLFLSEKKLVFYHADTKAYVLNKVEAYKWLELIRELKKPDWKRSWLFLKLSASIWFVIGGLIGGFIGGYSAELGKKLVDLTVKKSDVIHASAPAVAQTPNIVTGSMSDKK